MTADATAASLLGWPQRRRLLDDWVREWPGEEQARWLLALQEPRRLTRLACRWPGPPALQIAAEVRHGGFEAFVVAGTVDGTAVDVCDDRRHMAMPGLSVAQVGHELRTPLNAIVGFTQMIQANPDDPVALGNVEHIAGAARMMQRVVDDLIDHARLAAGRLEIDAAGQVAPARLLSGVGGTAPALLGSDDVVVGLRLDPHCPALLQGDPQRLGQILLNLVSNAARHTVRGEIVVECRVQARDKDAARLRFVVADTGTGIAATHLDRLGAPFVQATPAAGGSGLGLSVVRQLLDLLGSRLHLVSVLGGGTMAWFDVAMPVIDASPRPGTPAVAVLAHDRRWAETLSVHLTARGGHVVGDVARADEWWIQAGHPEAANLIAKARQEGRRWHLSEACSGLPPNVPTGSAGRPVSVAAPLSGLSLLVVDDSALNRSLMHQVLGRAGAQVTLASDVAGALACARRTPFDAAVLDLQLPDGDGRTLASRLHALAHCATLPVVFVSAFVDRDAGQGGSDSRLLGCLPKPFDPPRLIDLLAQAVTDGGRRTARRTVERPLEASTSLAALYAREVPRLAEAVRRARTPERLGQAVHALRGALAWRGDAQALALAAEVESGVHAGLPRSTLPIRQLLARARALSAG